MNRISDRARRNRFNSLTVAWLLALSILPMSFRSSAGLETMEKLVPARFTPFHNANDSDGYLWDFNQFGMVMNGTDSCFSQSFMLIVNNAQFQCSAAMMTADGSELVLRGGPQWPGLEVTRRCRVDPKFSGARFTDIFTNRGNAPVNINAQIFVGSGNGGWQSTISDAGVVNPAALDKNETGLVFFAPAQNGQVSTALYLAGPNAEVRPNLQLGNNGRPGFGYTFSLPPQKTAALVYGAVQCRLSDQPDGKGVAAILKPLSSPSWFRDLPSSLRHSIVNFGRLSGDVFWEEVGLGKLLATLETNPGPNDLLTFGAGTQLKGTATCGSFALETRFGTLNSSLDKVVAIIGSRNHNGKAVVVFRDGQLLAGKLQVEHFQFTLNSDLRFDISPLRIDRLIMRPAATPPAGSAAEKAAAAKAAADKVAILQTSEGERIALAPSATQNFTLVSPWGRIQFPLRDVVRISALAEPLGHRVVLRDGTRLFGYMDAAPMTLTTRDFGAIKASPLSLHEIRGLADEDDDPGRPAQPSVVLAGENFLIGRVDLATLHIIASGQTLAVPPNLIRKLRTTGDAAPESNESLVEAELGDGSKITGKLVEDILPIRCGQNLREVPTRDVVEIVVPTPGVCDSAKTRIDGLIRDLGSNNYEVRKDAAKTLRELGPVARPQLTEALQQTSDAEIHRAAQAILKDSGN